MAYAQSGDPRSRATAVVAVVAVHAGLGALLLYGLAANGVIKIEEPKLVGGQIPIAPPPPPPPPDPTPTQQVQPKDSAAAPKPYAPTPVFTFEPGPTVDTTDVFPPLPTSFPTAGSGGMGDTGAGETPLPTPQPSFDPVPARVANDASSWVTQSDYRTSWITREWAGTASFRLSIGTDGKVKQCSITRSTGHAALDDATCALVSKRAKFKPATGSSGAKVAGSYTGSVRWQIPR
ncbi:energy transducer TonB [Erythrobacter sp. LQ02-29]|uniref:TonB family protein n=1 Tax=Erythrobacter sp. LQ02-29 TaxID=2920384 RepID=UPI001F4D39C3|nr:TonB family protein [Erythrobacter sp. LQ02-29]MCP9222311.1 energy transducer TonB [Erythrobacter sp. LQ02-29]